MGFNDNKHCHSLFEGVRASLDWVGPLLSIGGCGKRFGSCHTIQCGIFGITQFSAVLVYKWVQSVVDGGGSGRQPSHFKWPQIAGQRSTTGDGDGDYRRAGLLLMTMMMILLANIVWFGTRWWSTKWNPINFLLSLMRRVPVISFWGLIECGTGIQQPTNPPDHVVLNVLFPRESFIYSYQISQQ